MNQVLKLKFGNHIRKVSNAPSTIQELIELAKNRFRIEDFMFQYEDEDGEMITIDSQSEYIEALNCNITKFIVVESEQIRDQGPLKKSTETIQKFSKEKPVLVNSFTDSVSVKDFSSQTSEMNLLLAELGLFEFSTNEETTEYNCNECKNLIKGPVFVCRECENFIICSNCEEEDFHGHLLIKSKSNDVKSLLKPSKVVEKQKEIEGFVIRKRNFTTFETRSPESELKLKKNHTFVDENCEGFRIIVEEIKDDKETVYQNIDSENIFRHSSSSRETFIEKPKKFEEIVYKDNKKCNTGIVTSN